MLADLTTDNLAMAIQALQAGWACLQATFVSNMAALLKMDASDIKTISKRQAQLLCCALLPRTLLWLDTPIARAACLGRFEAGLATSI